jgi:hypothetical protein
MVILHFQQFRSCIHLTFLFPVFSADLLLEERIEYNDLVDSIQDVSILCDDKHSDTQANGDENSEPKNGNVSGCYSLSFPLFLLVLLTFCMYVLHTW